MATQTWKWIVFISVCLVWSMKLADARPLNVFTFSEPHLGTIIDLTIYAPEETVANEAARTAFARVKELDRIFSDYKPDSEAMRLCESAGAGRPIKVSSELFHVLKQAIAISEQTDGAFDVTVGPLVKLWRRARKEKALPTADEIAAAKELVGWKLVVLNETEKTVELKRAGMRLDFGGIAKGYVAQDVSRVLREKGLDRTLVAVAGDIVAGDAPERSSKPEGWQVGVAPLKAGDWDSRLLSLRNRAVSTSGDAFQFVEIGGVRYSHIVDPQTGLGLTHRSSVTVVADDGATADAWATAVCVLGPDRGMKIVEALGSIDVLIVQVGEDSVRVVESKKFRRHQIK